MSIGVDVWTYRHYELGAVNDPRLGFSVRSPSRRRILDRLSAELGIAEAELLVGDSSDTSAPPPSTGFPEGAWATTQAVGEPTRATEEAAKATEGIELTAAPVAPLENSPTW